MSAQTPIFQAFSTRAEADAAAVKFITGSIETSVNARGKASILLSGGSTPCAAYALLSGKELAWENTSVSLIDDRWVPETNEGSNASMIRRKLLTGPASKADFIPLVSGHAKPKDGIEEVSARMKPLTRAPDLCLMGMGSDGHTASWFPGSKGLQAAMDINAPNDIAAIDAVGCPGAGVYPDRITLTLPAVMRARSLLLFITGEEKRRVWDESEDKSVFDAPVGALRAAGERMTIIWAP